MKTSTPHYSAPVAASSQAGVAPIVWWAAAGAICFAFSAYVFGQWFLSDTAFAAVPIGPEDAISDAALLKIRAVEVVSTLVALAALYWYCLRPVLGGQKMTMEGLLLLGALVSYVLDTSINYFGYYMAWNKHAINFGTWGGFFPGHVGPTNYAEAWFWGPPMYIYFGVALASIQLAAMGAIRRLSNCGFLVAMLLSFPIVFLFDLFAESIIIRLGAYAWPETVGALTLWKGEIYQFPLYESFLVGVYACMYSALMHYRDAQGLTWIERGVDRFAGGLQLPLRFFAACGFAFLCTFIYFFGFNLFSAFADNTVTMPSYLMYAD